MGEIEEWRDHIYVKLSESFGDDVESCMRVQHYLDEVDMENRDTDVIPPALQVLKLSLNSDPAFQTYATRLADDTRTAENDPGFRTSMKLKWDRILKALDEVAPMGDIEKWKDQVYFKLSEFFGDDVESFMRVQHYLNEIEMKYRDSDVLPPALWNLKLSLNLEHIFYKFATRLSDDTRTTENDPRFRNSMELMWDRILKPSDEFTKMGELEEIKVQIYLKLSEVFNNDVESFMRVQHYLDEVKMKYRNSDVIPPALRTLKLSLNLDHKFKTYATRLSDDTRTAENDPRFRESMELMGYHILKASNKLTTMGEIEDWKLQIYSKLYELFSDNIDSLLRVYYYLDKVDMEYKDSGEIPPALRTLKLSLNSKHMFKTYAIRLSNDTEITENNLKFIKTMDLMWNRTDSGKISPYCSQGLNWFWNVLPLVKRQQIISAIPRIINNKAIMGSINEVVDMVGGRTVMVALVGVTLSREVILNIWEWWNGDITGKRCLKNIVDSSVSIGAGIGGCVIGAAVGSSVGPLGTLIGGIVGSVVAGQTANYLIDRLTKWIFGIPKDKALENAYNYLGVSTESSNHDINASYKVLCLKHHPDKGGNKEDFCFLQFNMSVIKAARGELH